MRPQLVRFALAASTLAGLSSAAAAQGNLLVRVGKAYLSPDRTVDHASILIENGKIAEIVPRKSVDERSDLHGRADAVLDLEGAVATAGFLDVHSHAGAKDELAEIAESFTPELSAAAAYDPFAPELKRLIARGVTSIVLAPDDRSLAGGTAAFVKCGKPPISGDAGAYLKMSMTKDAITRQRRPTSLMGAADWLREAFTSLEGTQPDDLTPAQRAIAVVAGGGRPVGLACRETREILAALDAASAYRMSAFLIHADDAAKCLPQIQAADAMVVLDPLGFDSPRKALLLPGQLAGRGIVFAFAGEGDDRSGAPRLQQSLALAVASGLSAQEALASVTTVPAQIAGLAERVGTLFRGRDADIAIWSREPWDLRARLLAVVQDGATVHENGANDSK